MNSNLNPAKAKDLGDDMLMTQLRSVKRNLDNYPPFKAVSKDKDAVLKEKANYDAVLKSKKAWYAECESERDVRKAKQAEKLKPAAPAGNDQSPPEK